MKVHDFVLLVLCGASASAGLQPLQRPDAGVGRLPLSYAKLQFPDHVLETARLLTEAFGISESHSWARALGLDQFLELNGLTDDYIPRRMYDEELGCFGCFAETLEKKLIGTVVLEKMNAPGSMDDDFEPQFRGLSSAYTSYSMNAMHALVHQCKVIFHQEFLRRQRGEYRASDAVYYGEDSRVAFFAWLATDLTIRGRGIAGSLVEEAVTHSRKSMYTHGVAFAASPQSKRVFLRAGFEEWGGVRYDLFEYGNERPFASLPDECTVLVKYFCDQ
jgi:GNAT superfamily N-acetyltransferase